MTVDILCRVVDNLGDIGFVYRLARALGELPDAPLLRLIVDDLSVFAGICPSVKADATLQCVEGFLVVRRDNPGAAAIEVFRAERPRMVLECYACGRPEWFEEILFDEGDPVPRNIVNLEYLTAETWAHDYHLLPSLTRSSLVRKTIFMPGFQEGTGGLIQDKAFSSLIDTCATDEGKRDLRREILRSGEFAASSESFWVLVFSYEHDFSPIVADLSAFHAERPILAIVAPGKSSAPFLDAWNRAGQPFSVLVLPLLPQQKWDAFLVASDFSIVRGEETFARSVLAGHPFLWQCYPFASGAQLPKVHAFLERIKLCIDPDDFKAYEGLTLAFNETEPKPGDFLAVLRISASGFGQLATEVRNLGNLAAKVLTFMRSLGYTND